MYHRFHTDRWLAGRRYQEVLNMAIGSRSVVKVQA